MKILGKVALSILIAFVGLFGLAMAYLFISYPPPGYIFNVVRGLANGSPSVYDYEWLDARPMTASLSPYYFKEEPAEAMVQALFEQNPAIDDLDDFLKRNQTQAFIVIQNDTILYEKYFNGASRDTIVTSFSTAKSWTSALIGAAIADGYIQSVDDPITVYLPELVERDPAFADITIRDLLLMSSGMKFEETGWFDGDDAKASYYPDGRKLVLEETTIIDPPGSYYLYNKIHPLFLGMILERATGMHVADYLETRIWHPIGMEHDGSWSLDDRGFEKMEIGVNGRAIDFAKLGRLYLNNGNWNGTQVLPADWVAESTRPDPSRDTVAYYRSMGGFNTYYGGWYGYMWLGMPRDESNDVLADSGNLGQYIHLSPHKNLIIVRNGEDFGEFGTDWFDLFYKFASLIE